MKAFNDSRLQSSYWALRVTFIAVPILAGLDKLLNLNLTDFSKIGVQLKQKALDSTAATNLMQTTYQYDLAMWDWTALLDPDFMLSVTTCAQYHGGWNDSGYCNKKYDKMYSQQQLTPNQTKRRQIVWNMQKYLYTQRPYLWLANDDSVSAVSKNWAGFKNTPQGPFNELNISTLTQVHQK